MTSFARQTHVAALTPEGVGESQPKRRRPGPGRKIDIKAGVFLAQLEDEPPHGLGIPEVVGTAAGVHTGGDAIELEVIDAVVADHPHAGVLEGGVIARPGQGEAGGIGFVALLRAEPAAAALWAGRSPRRVRARHPAVCGIGRTSGPGA